MAPQRKSPRLSPYGRTAALRRSRRQANYQTLMQSPLAAIDPLVDARERDYILPPPMKQLPHIKARMMSEKSGMWVGDLMAIVQPDVGRAYPHYSDIVRACVKIQRKVRVWIFFRHSTIRFYFLVGVRREYERAAATKMQCCYRNGMAWRRFRKMLFLRNSRMATRIQKLVRGHLSREHSKRVRKNRIYDMMGLLVPGFSCRVKLSKMLSAGSYPLSQGGLTKRERLDMLSAGSVVHRPRRELRQRNLLSAKKVLTNMVEQIRLRRFICGERRHCAAAMAKSAIASAVKRRLASTEQKLRDIRLEVEMRRQAELERWRCECEEREQMWREMQNHRRILQAQQAAAAAAEIQQVHEMHMRDIKQQMIAERIAQRRESNRRWLHHYLRGGLVVDMEASEHVLCWPRGRPHQIFMFPRSRLAQTHETLSKEISHRITRIASEIAHSKVSSQRRRNVARARRRLIAAQEARSQSKASAILRQTACDLVRDVLATSTSHAYARALAPAVVARSWVEATSRFVAHREVMRALPAAVISRHIRGTVRRAAKSTVTGVLRLFVTVGYASGACGLRDGVLLRKRTKVGGYDVEAIIRRDEKLGRISVRLVDSKFKVWRVEIVDDDLYAMLSARQRRILTTSTLFDEERHDLIIGEILDLLSIVQDKRDRRKLVLGFVPKDEQEVAKTRKRKTRSGRTPRAKARAQRSTRTLKETQRRNTQKAVPASAIAAEAPVNALQLPGGQVYSDERVHIEHDLASDCYEFEADSANLIIGGSELVETFKQLGTDLLALDPQNRLQDMARRVEVSVDKQDRRKRALRFLSDSAMAQLESSRARSERGGEVLQKTSTRKRRVRGNVKRHMPAVG